MHTSSSTAVDLVIFDCDGVLIDSEPISARTLAETLTEAGLPMSSVDVQREFTGMTDTQMFEVLVGRGLGDRAGIETRWRETLYAAFRAELREMEDVGDIVRALPVHRCVASNSSLDRLKNSLGTLEIWEAFGAHVYSAEMVARPKPAPDLVIHCLEAFGVAPGRAIFIDDSAQGVRAAKAAGVRGIGFIGASDARPDQKAALMAAGATAVVTGMSELRRYLAEDLGLLPVVAETI